MDFIPSEPPNGLVKLLLSIFITIALGLALDLLGLRSLGWKLFGGVVGVGADKVITDTLIAPERDPCINAETHWKSAESRGRIDAFQDHLEKFSGCSFAALAEQSIAALKNAAMAAPGSPGKAENVVPSPARATAPNSQALRVLNKPVTRPASRSPCTQRARFDRAQNTGTRGLRSFLSECEFVGGTYVRLALTTLESNLFREADKCFNYLSAPCDVESCLSIYRDDFPNGSRFLRLRRKADRVLGSSRCRPPRRSPPSAVMRSNRHWCPYPESPAGWYCHISQRCNPAGGCIGQEPRLFR